MSTPTAAILLSRQPRRPHGGLPWVRHTVEAITWLRKGGYHLVSSVGLQTWELVTAAGSLAGIPQTVYLPCADTASFERNRAACAAAYGLESGRDRILAIIRDGTDRKARELMARRDQTIVAAADLLLPVSVRPGGFMARAAETPAKQVRRDFETAYHKRATPLRYEIDPRRLHPAVDDLDTEYLFHWTRSSPGPWPTERPLDYYRDVIHSDRYPRTAFDTLANIFMTGRLCGSGRHLPKKVKAVAFSGLRPREAVPLMRWRARYGEMSFEPYAIGIERKWAESHGILPVAYYDPSAGEQPDASIRWRAQSVGRRTDWRHEEEYRHAGDLLLSEVPADKLIVLCRTGREAAVLERRINRKTLPLCLDETV